jgi:hypothetical protein
MICKWSINPITNPNPVYMTHTHDNINMYYQKHFIYVQIYGI